MGQYAKRKIGGNKALFREALPPVKEPHWEHCRGLARSVFAMIVLDAQYIESLLKSGRGFFKPEANHCLKPKQRELYNSQQEALDNFRTLWCGYEIDTHWAWQAEISLDAFKEAMARKFTLAYNYVVKGEVQNEQGLYDR